MAIPESKKIFERQGEEMIVLVIVTLFLFGGMVLGILNWPFELTGNKNSSANAELFDNENQENTVNPELGTAVSFLGYAQGRGWEGEITEVLDKSYKIKITKVITHSAKYFALFPQPCSGNVKLDASSVGMVIEIPKECLQ